MLFNALSPDWLKIFLIYSFCTFLQASIVTVIHHVNAVVDTVTKEGIVMPVLCVCVHSDCPWSCVLLPTVVLYKVLMLWFWGGWILLFCAGVYINNPDTLQNIVIYVCL